MESSLTNNKKQGKQCVDIKNTDGTLRAAVGVFCTISC